MRHSGFLACCLVVAVLQLPGQASAWMAIGPITPAKDASGNGTVHMFGLNDDGTKGKDVLVFPIGPGETLGPNSFTCGRCFCLLLTQNQAAATSYLYNATFCGTPGPPGIPPQGVHSRLAIPSLTTNLHSNYGEGDGGNGYSIELAGAKQVVVEFDGGTQKTRRIVDISAHVKAVKGGTIAEGSSAMCPGRDTLWVGVTSASGNGDTLLTIDLKARRVASATILKLPLGAGLFANCKTDRPGSVLLQTAGKANAVTVGEYDILGNFVPVDSIKLPEGSNLDVTPIVDTIVWQSVPWATELGAVLMGKGFTLPGALLTTKAESPGGERSAVLSPLKELVMSIALAY